MPRLASLLLVFSTLGVFASPATAQSWARPDWNAPRIGVKGGLSLGTLHSAPMGLGSPSVIGYHPGFAAGLFGQIPTSSDYLAIQLEALYTRKGATVEGRQGQRGTSFADLVVDLDYLEIPVLLNVGIPGLHDRFRPVLHAGMYFGFNLHQKTAPAEPLGDDEFGERESATYIDQDFGFLAGLGFEVLVGDRLVTFSGRYDRGYIFVSNSAARSRYYEDPTLFTGALLVTLGVAL